MTKRNGSICLFGNKTNGGKKKTKMWVFFIFHSQILQLFFLSYLSFSSIFCTKNQPEILKIEAAQGWFDFVLLCPMSAFNTREKSRDQERKRRET